MDGRERSSRDIETELKCEKLRFTTASHERRSFI